MTEPRPFRTFALSKRHPDTHAPLTQTHTPLSPRPSPPATHPGPRHESSPRPQAPETTSRHTHHSPNKKQKMSVKFKPTQIAMPLSANYGRWYAKMVPAGANTAADFGAHRVLLHCYIVTLLHVTLRSFHNARCIR